MPHRRFLRRLPTFLLPCLLLLALDGCGPNQDPRNVLIIAIDTLRADHTSLYGYERPTTPCLEAFARDATVWDRAMTPSSWTRTSFASYFTGLYPLTHGCVNRHGQLAEGHLTLAERFKEAGWATAAIYANANIAPEFGLDQGFDLYVHPPENAGYPEDFQVADAAAVNARTFAWLQNERPTDRPWFLFLLYIDPHDPYLPHPEHLFGDARPTDELNGSRRVLEDLDHNKTPTEQVDEARRIVRNLYDGEVAYVDRHVGALLDELDRLDLSDDTVVILLVDHGEGLWDHDDRGHGKQVYQEQIHVPLIVRWPGRTEAGAHVDDPVGVMDIFPTLTEAFGLGDADESEGRSLFAPPPPETRRLYVDQQLGRRFRRSTLVWPWKLTIRYGGAPQLFNLDADPRERRSVYGAYPGVVRQLDALADSIKTAGEVRREGIDFSEERRAVDEGTERKLEALGY